MTKLEKAVEFATRAHEGQVRKATDVPYIEHPLEVLDIVKELTEDEDVLCAAVLHDVLEDCGIGYEKLEEEFGERVAFLVGQESENKRAELPAELTWRVRKEETIAHLKTAEDDVLKICLGDKLSNARAIKKDFDEIGDKVFDRFNASKEDEIWYYRSIASVLYRRLEMTDMLEELIEIVSNEPFSKSGWNSFIWLAKLNELLEKYPSDTKAVTAAGGEIVAHLLLGISLEVDVPCVIEPVNVDSNKWLKDFLTDDDGYGCTYSALQTDRLPHNESQVIYDDSILGLLMKIVRNDNDEIDLGGLVINPYEQLLVVSREIIKLLIACKGVTYDRAAKEKHDGIQNIEHRVATYRGVSDEEFALILKIILNMTALDEEQVLIELLNYVKDDELDSIKIEKEPAGYRMSLIFNMEDLGWDEKLVLSCEELSYTVVEMILWELICEATPSGDIDFISENFKQI